MQCSSDEGQRPLHCSTPSVGAVAVCAAALGPRVPLSTTTAPALLALRAGEGQRAERRRLRKALGPESSGTGDLTRERVRERESRCVVRDREGGLVVIGRCSRSRSASVLSPQPCLRPPSLSPALSSGAVSEAAFRLTTLEPPHSHPLRWPSLRPSSPAPPLLPSSPRHPAAFCWTRVSRSHLPRLTPHRPPFPPILPPPFVGCCAGGAVQRLTRVVVADCSVA